MEEIEVILVPNYLQHYNILSYPITQLKEFNRNFQLKNVMYGTVSQNLELQFVSIEPSEQKPDEVFLESTIIPNRTFMTVCKLLDNKLYVFPIRQFARIKPRISRSAPIQIEKRSQGDELIFQRNKAKYLEIMKKSWNWQHNIKSQEKQINLNPSESELEIPLLKERNILNLKPIHQQGFQAMLFDCN